MILESLKLKNIRSYHDLETTVEFPQGTVLFEGDVGSGKSTLLYAVEFALFGLGDMRAPYLLTEGKDHGYVTLRFMEQGRSYEVHRELRRRRNGVNQEDCYITTEGKKEILPPSDLKSRIADILKFNEPTNPRAGSLIFRFSIFTPQEQMKEIVLRRAEERLQTLRRVFGVEEYKVAADNSDLLRHSIQNKTSGLFGKSEHLKEKEAELKKLKEEIDALERELPNLVRKERESGHNLDELRKRQIDLEKTRTEIQSRDIRKLRDRENKLKRKIEEEQNLQKEKTKRLKENESEIAAFNKRREPDKHTLKEIERRREELNRTIEQKKEGRGRLEQQLQDTTMLIQEGICPVCGQPIDPSAFGGRAEHLRKDISEVDREIKSLGKELGVIKDVFNERMSYEEQRKNVQHLERECKDIKKTLKSSQERLQEYREELEGTRKELREALKEASKLQKINEEIERINQELSSAQKLQKQSEKELTTVITQLREKKKSFASLREDVAQMKLARERAYKMKEYEIWLSEYFRPTVELIERQVMLEMNDRFNQEFQRFFAALIDDPEVRVRVDEEFTPIFERQDFEQEYDALSGGERTSIALAYRLALNLVLQQEAETGAGDLLILDEPTDGFSKEQLSKMRDILKTLNSKQVIIVSHERELEAIADHIFRVEKGEDGSKVSR